MNNHQVLDNRTSPSLPWPIQRFRQGQVESTEDHVALEEPFEIVVNGQSIAVLMRMPGQEKELAAGFCITEGYVRDVTDILLIHHCGSGLPAPGEQEQDMESRNRVTLCRCGLSKNMPLCDGTHRRTHVTE